MNAPYSGDRLPSPGTRLGGTLAHVVAARRLTALHRRLRGMGATTDPAVLEYLDALHYFIAEALDAHVAVLAGPSSEDPAGQ